MRKIIQYKDNLSSEISEKIKSSKSFIIFEYSGLDAHTITKLRKDLFKTKSNLLVLKNNILNRALKKANISEFGDLVGPNAIAWGTEDEIAPLKEVYNLIKENDFIKIKGSYVEGSYLDEQKTKSIASLPNREGLYSMLLSCLTGPIRGVLYALKAVSETKN
ncbi:MAG: 50S ribosomal protein L10 [Malacoplasma sp.]|nr:50S ribosomal protein L10 [Malacoplasma sp.]MDE6894239.1 50S ribosomal protein L10 [Malacoplasma sp.]